MNTSAAEYRALLDNLRQRIAEADVCRDPKRFEMQLRHAQRMEVLGRLTSSITHEFNNLLTAILGYTDQLLETEQINPIGRELREIKRASEMAVALTRQILAFSRGTPPVVQVLDVNDVLANINGLLYRLIGKGARFTLTTAAEHACIRATTGMLEQVIINLAMNARDALPRPGGGAIAIRTWNTSLPARVGDASADESRRYLVIDVADTGVGMSAEVASRLFEPFFTTKAPGKGTGLGLATAHSIVHEAGGWLDVETAEGQGTTFRVFLPVAPAR
jgi:signal transduction histidine kinase